MKMLTDEQKKQAIQAFDHLDVEGTGTIPKTVTSLAEAVRLSGLNPTEAEVRRHMSADEGDVLDKEQFLGFAAQFNWRTRQELKDSLCEDFRMFTETGTIEPEDLVHILTKEGRELLPINDVSEALCSFPTDGQGSINIDELVTAWLNPQPS